MNNDLKETMGGIAQLGAQATSETTPNLAGKIVVI